MELPPLAGHENQIELCTFSSDGKRLLSAGNDNTLRIWDVPRRKQIAVIRLAETAMGCAFSPDVVKHESEALFLGTVNPGQAQGKGASLGRIVLRGRLLRDDYQLNERAQAWIRGFKAHFQMERFAEQIPAA